MLVLVGLLGVRRVLCVAVGDFVVCADLNEPSPRGLDGPRGAGDTG